MSATPTRTGSAAIAWARAQIKNPSKGYYQLCLQFTRMCFGVAASAPDANAGWANARKRHATTKASSIPAGVPVWWAVGRYGHVAIATGNGKCVSNDILRRGEVDEVSIDLITKRWGAKLLGWSEDINGVTVYNTTNPTTPNVLKEDIMASLTELRTTLRATLTEDKLVPVGKTKWSFSHLLDWLRRKSVEDGAKIVALQASVKALAAKQGLNIDQVYASAYKGALDGATADEIEAS